MSWQKQYRKSDLLERYRDLGGAVDGFGSFLALMHIGTIFVLGFYSWVFIVVLREWAFICGVYFAPMTGILPSHIGMGSMLLLWLSDHLCGHSRGYLLGFVRSWIRSSIASKEMHVGIEAMQTISQNANI